MPKIGKMHLEVFKPEHSCISLFKSTVSMLLKYSQETHLHVSMFTCFLILKGAVLLVVSRTTNLL